MSMVIRYSPFDIAHALASIDVANAETDFYDAKGAALFDELTRWREYPVAVLIRHLMRDAIIQQLLPAADHTPRDLKVDLCENTHTQVL